MSKDVEMHFSVVCARELKSMRIRPYNVRVHCVVRLCNAQSTVSILHLLGVLIFENSPTNKLTKKVHQKTFHISSKYRHL